MSGANTQIVPTLQVGFEDISLVFSLAEERFRYFPYPDFDVTFSCSPNGIWPATRRGFIPPEERVLVNGQSWVLDTVAALFRGAMSPNGGRFIVSLDAATRALDGALICGFEIGA